VGDRRILLDIVHNNMAVAREARQEAVAVRPAMPASVDNTLICNEKQRLAPGSGPSEGTCARSNTDARALPHSRPSADAADLGMVYSAGRLVQLPRLAEQAVALDRDLTKPASTEGGDMRHVVLGGL
jgi:hypothetical protein